MPQLCLRLHDNSERIRHQKDATLEHQVHLTAEWTTPNDYTLDARWVHFLSRLVCFDDRNDFEYLVSLFIKVVTYEVGIVRLYCNRMPTLVHVREL